MSKSYSSLGVCGATVTLAVLVQGCAANTAADSGDVSPPGEFVDGGDGDGDPLGGSSGDGDGDGDGDASDPVLGNEDSSEQPVLAGQGGAYEMEAPAPRPCVTLLSLGEVATEGGVPGERGMDAVVSWLNEYSNAKAEYLREEPMIDEYLLEDIDVILLQDISRWEFDQEELDVFQKWVEAGGGVMALSGYSGALSHTFPANELLSFSGLNHSMTQTAQDVAAHCGYCLGTTHKQGGWNTNHPIADGVSFVGAFSGRAIHGTGDIVSSENGLNLAVSKEVGDGRVFFFHDDWVTYVTNWSGDGLNRCENDAGCSDVSIDNVYQMPRFWFNSIKWLSGDSSCFRVDSL